MTTNTRLDGQTFEVPPPSDEQLLGIFAAAQQESVEAHERVGRLEQELMRRAAERGATTIYGKDMNYIITQKPDYARDRLHPLLELLDQNQRDECFTPEGYRETWQEAKWDMTKVKKHARARGKEALDIVEAATFPGKASGKLVKTE